MPVPSISGSAVTADKRRYLVRNAGLRHKLVRGRIPLCVVKRIALRDDGKYFVVHHRRRYREFLQTMNLNQFITAVHSVIKSPSAFSLQDMQAFIDGSPLGLFELARLHECFTSELLSGTQAEYILLDFNLRKGIAAKAIVPMIRAFNVEKFARVQSELGSVKDIVSAAADASSYDRQWVELGLDNLRAGYPWRRSQGIYRISQRHSEVIYGGLSIIAESKGNTIILPSINDLFSYEPNVFEYGTKNGTKPLGLQDGAIY